MTMGLSIGQHDTDSPTIRFCEKKSTRLISIICFVGFAWVAWLSRSFPPPFNPADVGPGEVPSLAAYVGMTCSVLMFIVAGRFTGRLELRRPKSVLSGILVISGYVVLIPFLGFYVMSGVAVPLLMLAGGEHRPLRLVLAAAGFDLFIYLCFQLLLGVQFP